MRRILSGHLNNKGVTLITLIIAITIFAIFVTVFSYVMVAKHGSSALYVQSTQAYAVAQAGIEYGIRCAQDSSCWDYTATATLEKDFGDGSFDLVYDDSNNTLTSTGMVGVATRKIILSSFSGSPLSSYVEAAAAGGIDRIGDPSLDSQAKNIYVPLINNYGKAVYIYEITLTKTDTQTRMISIEFESTEVWSGDQYVPAAPDFPFNQVSYYYMAQDSEITLSLIARRQQQPVGNLYGDWTCTFWYSEQSDLSDPQSNSITFTIP